MKDIVNTFRLNKKTLVLDGAMGSHLHKLGYTPHPQLWFSHLNKTNPEVIFNIHRNYIAAGADIVTTNTFRTNPAAVQGTSFNSEELIISAVASAKSAVNETNVLIAGSNPPAEDSYQRKRNLTLAQLTYNHEKHIELLYEHNCDFVLNETQSHLDEIEIICRTCTSREIPFVVSLYFDENLKILSGENISEVIPLILDFNPLAVSFNCVSQTNFRSLLNKLVLNYSWGFYLNYGLGDINDKRITEIELPGSEDDILLSALSKKVSFIGGCCGTGPEHILNIRKIVDGNYNPEFLLEN